MDLLLGKISKVGCDFDAALRNRDAPVGDDDVVDAAVVFRDGELRRQAAIRPDLSVPQRPGAFVELLSEEPVVLLDDPSARHRLPHQFDALTGPEPFCGRLDSGADAWLRAGRVVKRQGPDLGRRGFRRGGRIDGRLGGHRLRHRPIAGRADHRNRHRDGRAQEPLTHEAVIDHSGNPSPVAARCHRHPSRFTLAAEAIPDVIPDLARLIPAIFQCYSTTVSSERSCRNGLNSPVRPFLSFAVTL